MEPETVSHPGRKRSSLLARFTVPVVACVLGALAAVGFVADGLTRNARAQVTASTPPPADLAATIARLEAETKRLGALVPNQPTVMTHVAYHFTNLWFAAQRGNWPLAGYYLGEVRSNLKWAARIRPVRETPAGEVDVAGIAEAVDNTELAALAAAVEAKERPGFARAERRRPPGRRRQARPRPRRPDGSRPRPAARRPAVPGCGRSWSGCGSGRWCAR